MSKKLKTPSEHAATPVRKGLPVHGVAGLVLLFVCGSIVYANYMVFVGLPFSIVNCVLLAPSTLFVAGFLIFKAVR